VTGYPVQELCRRCSFEEVAYLQWHGELPAREQISAQHRAERAQRVLGPEIADAIVGQPFAADPLRTLRTVVTLLGAQDPAAQDISPGAIRAKALRLFAVLPTVIAMDQRRRHGLGAVAPRDHLGYAANFLYMTFGKVPEPQVVAAFETSLILHAEQSFNVPSSTGRAVTSAISGFYSAIEAAIDALKCPGPGPASVCEAVVDMMAEIAIPDNVEPWLEEGLAAGRKITGFGHCSHKDGDPRVPAMRAALGMIAGLRGGQDIIEIYDALAAAMYDARGLRPNLGYPAGPSYRLIGFDTPTFAPIFFAACLPGWTARIVERLSGADSSR
jgi:citrate synthase